MALFDSKTSLKVTLDDTSPLTCYIDGAQKNGDHIEYQIRVQRGPLVENSWQLTKRYSDFVSLDSVLKLANIELPLPPKKLIGNFDRDFVAERQKGLQQFLDALLAHPLLASSLYVKRFLDEKNYAANLPEIALQHVSMAFRSQPDWDVVEPQPEIGWRIRKHYILVKPIAQPKVRQMLSWSEYGPDKCIPEKELAGLMKVLSTIKHPYIHPVIYATANENGGMVIHPYSERGTLHDVICKCKPKGHVLKKYGNPKLATTFTMAEVKTYGRQILETLKFLEEKGFPYGHLHLGNIIIEGNTSQLLALENSLLGLPSYYRPYVTDFKKIQTTEMIDIYGFGHLLYTMVFGYELNAPTCDTFPPECPAQIRSVLESILTTEACKNGLPSVTSLLSHPLFVDVTLTVTDKPQLKIPSKLKEFVRKAREEIERHLHEDQKILSQVKRRSKAKQFHFSEEEKKKRRKSRKKALENGETDPASSASSATTASVPTSPSQSSLASSSSSASQPAPTSATNSVGKT